MRETRADTAQALLLALLLHALLFGLVLFGLWWTRAPESVSAAGDRLRLLNAANDRFFITAASDSLHFDLPAYVRHRLIAAGIDEVETQ